MLLLLLLLLYNEELIRSVSIKYTTVTIRTDRMKR